MKLYRYVGPEAIAVAAARALPAASIRSVPELELWLRRTGHKLNLPGGCAVTFVVDEHGELRVADRGSEHVACAGGGPVRSAGELCVSCLRGRLQVDAVSNQSTGYCPEPESWPAVAAALDRIGLPHPGGFTHAVVFRRCPACGERSIMKDGWFVCALCGADLPAAWNFGP